MAYETGTSTGVVDLLGKLFTFATANGWTSDDAVGSGKAAMHRSNIYVSFAYDTSTPNFVGIYQALGHTTSGDPGTHPDDSGNGWSGTFPFSNAELIQSRHVGLGTGSFASYFFFESDTYLHVVVEVSTGVYRHFGFGQLIMFGDSITGGEYAYGQATQGSNASCLNGSTSTLLDGIATASALGNQHVATIHLESLPDAPHASTKWGISWQDWASSQGNDRQTTPRERAFVQGGFRGGPFARGLGHFAVGSQSGLFAGYPIQCFYRPPSGGSAPNDLYLLGYMPDVRGVDITYVAAGETISIGGDDWLFFPTTQKDLTSAVTGASQAQGIMYKKVTT